MAQGYHGNFMRNRGLGLPLLHSKCMPVDVILLRQHLEPKLYLKGKGRAKHPGPSCSFARVS